MRFDELQNDRYRAGDRRSERPHKAGPSIYILSFFGNCGDLLTERCERNGEHRLRETVTDIGNVNVHQTPHHAEVRDHKDQNGKDNIIQELNSQIEQYKIQNDEIKNEYNDKIEQFNNKIKNYQSVTQREKEKMRLETYRTVLQIPRM